MKLSTPSGSFELSILGYSEKTANWRDRNKLRCRISTLWRKQYDSQAAPLQTWEVSRLLTGLQAIWNKAAWHLTLSFNTGLSLDLTALTNDNYRLQIQLDRTLTPVWHPYPDFPLELDLLLSQTQLAEAIQDLSGQLASYPER